MQQFNQQKKAYEDATTHPIHQTVYQELECCIKNKKLKKAHKESSHHQFIDYVRDVIRRLDELLKNLQIASIAINANPPGTIWSKHHTKVEYIRYHYENWIIGVARYSDVTLQAINAVCRLGINEKDINERILVNHDFVPEDLKKLAILFSKGTSGIRSHKNNLTHRGGYFSDAEIEKLIKTDDNIRFMKMAVKENWFPDTSKVEYEIMLHERIQNRLFVKMYANKKRKELVENNIQIFGFHKQLLDELEKQVKLQSSNMEKHQRAS